MSQQNPFGKDPFGGGDLDEIKQSLKKHAPIIRIIGALILAGILLFAAHYTVSAEEVGIITTFGKYTKTSESGLHFRIPIVQKVYLVPTKRRLKTEFGFRTTSAGEVSQYARPAGSQKESMMLTGDLNVAVVEWIIHYQISDPETYLFKIRDGSRTLRDLSESTMREIVGDYSVTEVLTSGRDDILQKAREHLANLVKVYETGITIQGIELKDSAPPDHVKPSFNEVNQAEQERDQKQNEALAKYNRDIPRVQGEAEQLIEEARGYAVERVNKARGDVSKFADIQKEYASAPQVTRSRLYLETMETVMSNIEKKIIVDDEAKGVVPMLLPQAGKSFTVGGGER